MRFTIVKAEPFAYIDHISLELKLSQGSSNELPMPSGALVDEDNLDPLKELDQLPLRMPKEEALVFEWHSLDMLFSEFSGLRRVDMEIDISERLSKEDVAGVEESIGEHMVHLATEQKLAIKIINFSKPQAKNGL